MAPIPNTFGVASGRALGFTLRIAAAVVSGPTQRAIFGYGTTGGVGYSVTNLVSNTGVVANDTAGVGTARYSLAAASYGVDLSLIHI